MATHRIVYRQASLAGGRVYICRKGVVQEPHAKNEETFYYKTCDEGCESARDPIATIGGTRGAPAFSRL